MKYIALFTFGCFMVFQSFSWGRVVTVWNPNREMHYSQESRDALNQLVASTLQAKPKTQGVVYDSKRRAETIAAIWGITPENIDSYKQWGLK